MFTFARNCESVFQNECTIYTPTSELEFWLFHISPTFGIISHFTFSHSSRYIMVSHGFNLNFPMTNDVEHLKIFIGYSFFLPLKVSDQLYVQYFLGLSVLLHSENYLSILNTGCKYILSLMAWLYNFLILYLRNRIFSLLFSLFPFLCFCLSFLSPFPLPIRPSF